MNVSSEDVVHIVNDLTIKQHMVVGQITLQETHVKTNSLNAILKNNCLRCTQFFLVKTATKLVVFSVY